MSTTTFAEFYSLEYCSATKIIISLDTILKVFFLLTSLKFYVKKKHAPRRIMHYSKSLFCLVKTNLRNDRLQRFEGFGDALFYSYASNCFCHSRSYARSNTDGMMFSSFNSLSGISVPMHRQQPISFRQ